MNKQEAIEKIKNIDTLNINDKIAGQQVDMVIKNQVLDIVSHINEPKKPVVPKFVGEWIEVHKEDYSEWNEEARADFVFRAINDLFRFGDGFSPWDFTINEKISEWTTKNAYEFITAILFGYTVEKEKLYTVEIPNPNRTTEPIMYLSRDEEGKIFLNNWFLLVGQNWKKHPHAHLTEAEIRKDFDFLWQFAKQVEDK